MASFTPQQQEAISTLDRIQELSLDALGAVSYTHLTLPTNSLV